MTPDQAIDLFRTASAQQWRYNLERIEATTLQAIQKTVDKTRRQIVGEMASTMKDVNLRAHSERVLKELDDLSLGLRKQLGQDLQSATSYVGSRALQEQYDMMSVNGLSPLINNVALSPAQFNAFLTTNPVKGLLIPQWIDKAYGASVKRGLQEGILEELQVGALRGESYARIVSRLESGFDQLTKRELTTLTRTFFQDANTRAYDAIHKANADVIEGRIWTVAGDDRVCILCLPLSEELYRDGEPHPEMPRHPNCRCCWRAKTVSYRSLGIDIDELEPIERAVVTRGYEKDGKWVVPPVGTGGARIRSISFHKGGIKEAFPNMPEAQQKAMIGPRRHELLKAGKIGLDDMVDKRTGRLVLLEDLRAGRVPGGGGGRGPLPARRTVVDVPDSLDFNSSVDRSLTLKDVENACQKRYPEIAFDFEGMHLDTVKPSMKQFHKLAKEYPEVASRLKYIGGYQSPNHPYIDIYRSPGVRPGTYINFDPWPNKKTWAHATTDGERIAFNPAYYGDPARLQDSLNRSMSGKWHPVGANTFESIMTHEFGHQVDHWLKSKTKKTVITYPSATGIGNVADTVYSFHANNKATKKLSGYALTDTVEAFAESFAALYHSPRKDWTVYTKRQRNLLNLIGDSSKHMERLYWLDDLPAGSPERAVAIEEIKRIRKLITGRELP